MFIVVSAGDCRIAIGKAIEETTAKRDSDKAALYDRSFKSIHDGAVHNGLKPSLDDIAKMHAMAARDVEHAIESHPANEILQQLAIYQRMLLVNSDPDVAVDAQAFELFGQHLVKQPVEEAA